MTLAILFTPGPAVAETRAQCRSALPAEWTFYGARGHLSITGDPLVICGFSAGGAMLRDSVDFDALRPEDAVIVADGIHIREPAVPGGSPMPRAPWQKLLDRARRGEGPRVIVSHTYLTYTDTMRDDPRTPAIERPYQSTATSLRTLTGWELPEPLGHRGIIEKSEGRLTVISHESGVADAPAHGRQLTEHLPEMLRRLAAETVAVESAADPLPTWRDPSLTLAQRMISWIGAQLYLAPREIPGAKHEPRIVAYGEHCRRGGTWRGIVAGWTPEAKRVASATDEEAWCAKLQSAALVACWMPGDALPFCPRVSVAELYRDAVEAETWHAAGSGYVPQPGDLAILARAGGDPTLGGTGHVRMSIFVNGNTYRGVGGNEANTVVGAWHSLTDPDLRGWIRVG